MVNHDVLHLVRLHHALLGQQGLAAGEFPHQLGERLLRLPLEVGVDGDDYLLQGLVVVVGGLQQGSVAFGTAVLSVALVRRLVRPAVLFWVSSDVDAIAECGGVDDGEGDGAFLQHPHPPVVVHLVQLHELELVAVRDALDLDPLLRLDVPVHCLLPPLPAAVPRLPPLLRLPEGLPTHRRPVVDAQFVGTLLQVDALVLVVDHSADVEGDPAGGGVETAVSLVGGDAEGTQSF